MEILNTTTTTITVVGYIFISLAICTVASGAIALIMGDHDKLFLFVATFIGIGIMMTMIGICGDLIGTRTEIECTIDDDVSFHEICDKYEVIKQEGKIYTLRKKETK